MTYKEYILSHARVYDTPVGDFINDARSDRFLPDTASAIRMHIYSKGCMGAQQAEKECYLNYVKYCQRRGIEPEDNKLGSRPWM